MDTLADRPRTTATQSLLTQVCARSMAVGELEGVDGRRPYCTADGVGAVLAVFHRDGLTGPVTRVVSVNQACPATPFLATYEGVPVECAQPGEDYSRRRAHPDPRRRAGRPGGARRRGHRQRQRPRPAHQPRVRRAAGRRGSRGSAALDPPTRSEQLVDEHTTGRALGLPRRAAVNVLRAQPRAGPAVPAA